MKNLIIVGNGFDLAHGLKTGYADFITDLKMFPEDYEKSKNNENLLLNSLKENRGQLWSDIESTYFDILTKLEDKNHLQEKYNLPINAYQNSKILNDDFDVIKKCLSIYLLKQEKEFEIDNSYQNFFNHFKNEDAVVLNFNYTNTVKQYVNSKKIELIHIHGELGNESNPIIFGFAADQEESKKLLRENNNNHVRNIKKFNYLFAENEERLKEHLKSDYFNVFILGHSCGISDNLILSEIFNTPKIEKIIPFYYENRNGYFNTMVNIDRIIDDYSKSSEDLKSFSKLLPFPQSHKMPQKEDSNIDFKSYLAPLFEAVNASQFSY